MPIISIIVPVYKTEKYLLRCVDSILVQTFIDFECILVDDGSPDHCPDICDEYAAKDARIIVIHQENMGVAKARDSGLNKSTGKLVIFVDSDDWLEPKALELLYKKQQETNADIVLGSIRTIFPHGSTTYIHPEIINDIQPISYFLLYSFNSFHARLYRKSLFSNYVVPNTSIGEDLIVNVQIFSSVQAGKLQIIDDIVCIYDNTTDGAVNNTSTQIRDINSYLEYDGFKSLLWVEKYLNGLALDILAQTAFLFLAHSYIIIYMRYCKNVSKDEVDVFYEKYYKSLYQSRFFKDNLPIYWRILIPLSHSSISIGKIYIKLLNTVSNLKSTYMRF